MTSWHVHTPILPAGIVDVSAFVPEGHLRSFPVFVDGIGVFIFPETGGLLVRFRESKAHVLEGEYP